MRAAFSAWLLDARLEIAVSYYHGKVAAVKQKNREVMQLAMRNIETQRGSLMSDSEKRLIEEEVLPKGAPVVHGKPCELISGQPKAAAMGLYHFMCVKDPFSEDGTTKVQNEIESFVAKSREQAVIVTLLENATPEQRTAVERMCVFARTAEDEIAFWKEVAWLPKSATAEETVDKLEEELIGNFRYIMNEPASVVYVKGPNAYRDEGHEGMRFSDFMGHENVQKAELAACHVAALRLYTTLAFKYINAPLRSQAQFYSNNKPHPLPLTVAYVSEGIKKLRAAYAVDVARGTSQPVKCVWRGMKNLKMAEGFMAGLAGGTELAPMSTTTDVKVAASYSLSGDSLLFRVRVENFMQYGAELQWLSAFPSEAEILYPPLTYLEPTGMSEVVEFPGGVVFKIYEVKVTLP